MHNVLSNTEATITVEFIDADGYLSADAGSISWSLLDSDGSELTSGTINNSGGEQFVNVVIAAQYNTKTNLFAIRSLKVAFTVNTQPREAWFNYRVVDFVQTTATPEGVRQFIGMTVDEMPDHTVDIYEAYFIVSDMVGKAVLDAALASGTISAINANGAILATAVLMITPSLRMRTFQTMKSDTASLARYASMNFGELEAYARNLQIQSLAQIQADFEAATPPLLSVYGGTDVITGA